MTAVRKTRYNMYNTHFFDRVRAGLRPADDIKSGLQSVEIADCIRKRKESYFSE